MTVRRYLRFDLVSNLDCAIQLRALVYEQEDSLIVAILYHVELVHDQHFLRVSAILHRLKLARDHDYLAFHRMGSHHRWNRWGGHRVTQLPGPYRDKQDQNETWHNLQIVALHVGPPFDECSSCEVRGFILPNGEYRQVPCSDDCSSP